MSMMEAIAFRQQEELVASLAASVERLALAVAAMEERLAPLEAAERAIAARRAGDAARARKYRNVMSAAEMPPPIGC